MKYSVKVIVLMLVILVAILAVSIYSTHELKSSSDMIESHLSWIEEGIRMENWKTAGETLDSLKKQWQRAQPVWTVLVDHIEIDNIDTSIVRLSSLMDEKDKALALAEAAVLKRYVTHIPSKEYFNLKNIF